MKQLQKVWDWLSGQLLFLTFFGMWLLIMLFINFNAKVAQNASDTKQVVLTQNALLNKQNEVLDAIKQVTTDNQLTSKQQTDIIICMVKVPQAQRTTNIEEGCRNQALVSESQPTVQSIPQTTPPQTSPKPNPGNSSPQATTPSPQPNTLQQITNGIGNAVKNVLKVLQP